MQPILRLIKKYSPISALVVLNSCASTFNWPKHNINITANQEVKQIRINGNAITLNKGKAKVLVEREKKPLELVVETQDSIYQFHLPAKNSFNYIGGGLVTLGINWFVEKKHPKRYFHQKNIYVYREGQQLSVRRFAPTPKGSLMFDLTIPYANTIHARSTSNNKTENGFIGLSGGIDYFYKQDRYISLYGGAATDNEVPFPVGVDYAGDYKIQRANCFFVGVGNNYVMRSITLGYGVNFSQYRWVESDNTGASFIKSVKTTSTAGLSLTGNYRITKNFRTGLLYQPSFLILGDGIKAGYQHLISVQLIFKFRLR